MRYRAILRGVPTSATQDKPVQTFGNNLGGLEKWASEILITLPREWRFAASVEIAESKWWLVKTIEMDVKTLLQPKP